VGTLRLAAAQLDTVVGDLDGNVELILAALARAEEAGADVCVFPELAITGYPPEDLLLKPGFVADNQAALSKVAAGSGRCAAVVGYVEPLGAGEPTGAAPPPRPTTDTDTDTGTDTGTDTDTDIDIAPAGPYPARRLANAAAVCARGRVLGVYRKRLLPNYGVFDEQRWFTPGSDSVTLYRVAGCLVGVSICEDVWFDDGPVAAQGRAGASLVLNLNASPYSRGRRAERLDLLRRRVAEADCAIAYVNQVGGQDELVFDGASLVVDAAGRLVAAGRQFTADLVLADLELPEHAGAGDPAVVEVSARPAGGSPLPRALPEPLDPVAEVYEALVTGTRDYVAKNGFGGAVIALSGGIDSSLVAVVAADALGPDRVHVIGMPSRYSSDGSRADAADLAARTGIELCEVPIDRAHVVMGELLTPVLDGPPHGLTDENLQSRLRGVLLMAVSNARGWIVLTTGNKSEMATGYSTLYGDSAGGYAVIKDVPKTLVYELCRYRNRRGLAENGVAPIPESVLDKPPSAELRPDQRDDQSLPPYEVLDPVIEAYVEHDRTAGELVAEGFDPVVVDRVVRLVDGSEYKRRQMPPGVKITTKAFGKDRRMPITNHYRPRPADEGPTAVRPGDNGGGGGG
jgi:NAD+ synthase (glutamine-hydrolysing)